MNLRVSNAIKEIDEANASPDLFDHIILNNNITLATNEFFRKVRDWLVFCNDFCDFLTLLLHYLGILQFHPLQGLE